MSCHDSYEVIGTNGCSLGSTAPKGWNGCGHCSYCFSDGGFTNDYHAEMTRKLSFAAQLADRLNDALRAGDITEEWAMDAISYLR